MEETDDPGASTAMFRAFTEHGSPVEAAEATSNRGLWIVAGSAVVVVGLVVAALSML
jgi:hypothetical protein